MKHNRVNQTENETKPYLTGTLNIDDKTISLNMIASHLRATSSPNKFESTKRAGM